MKIMREPEVELVFQPEVDWKRLEKFLNKNFNKSLDLDDAGMTHYLRGYDADFIPMIAGKSCYKSWSVGKKNPRDYLGHIIESGHGSVLEHANFGVVAITTRAITHEIVRHRAGFAYSQESQRFCDERDNAFIMPLSVQGDERCEAIWLKTMEFAVERYVELADAMTERYKNDPLYKDLAPTDFRKKIREAARGALPNDTAAVIHMTANIRAWRHFLEMRSSRHAEAGIRLLADRVYDLLVAQAPICFGDYEKISLPDGTFELKTKFGKV